ncbi:chaperonin 10-like protein [Ilyonectria robusta]|uniref:chaperonin 10-like protein n=1 Tax=Ilyonectria robusta TaxID=1079257 RepID=UPI001E8CB497|nr:chaperonin 10-like protein [Ilyonectria robusta]KAH8656257.1 chaperonin 10-like protein [Ilyonectria robusta]
MEASSTRTVQALRFYKKGQIQLEQVPALPCGPDEVRLKVAYCGICGSDIHEFLGGPIFPPAHGETHPFTGVKLPVTMGHEFSGTITQVGSGVNNLKLGQNVTVNPGLDHRHYQAELCGMCKEGRYNTCDAMTTYGLNAPGGGFCEEIVVKAMNCFVLPTGVSLKAGALAEPLAVAQHCVDISGFQSGQTALICGAGPIGLALVITLRAMGAAKIIVTEVTELRMAQAKNFGADVVINPLQRVDDNKDPVLAVIYNVTVDGVDVAFDATGLQSTLDLAIAGVRTGGTIFNVAIHEKPLLLNLNDLAQKEKKLMGGISYTNKDFEAVLRTIAEGKIDVEQMITSIVPLSNVVDGGFNELISNKSAHVKILIQPGQ